MGKNLRDLRNRATGGVPSQIREVVKVERVTETVEEPPAQTEPTPPVEEKQATDNYVTQPPPASDVPDQNQETPVQSETAIAEPQQDATPVEAPVPVVETLQPENTATQPTTAFLGGAIDLGALLQQATVADTGEEEETQKITIYLEPGQAIKLESLLPQLEVMIGRDPKLLQLVFRYLLDTMTSETFKDFPNYVREKRIEKIVEAETARLQKQFRRMDRRYKRVTGQ